MKLLVATHNQGKVAELAALLRDFPVECINLADIGISADVDETGITFRENGILKAQSYAQMGRLLTLADDSGLEVAALDGRPGVYTARYGGADLTQPQRNALLLRELAATNTTNRAAQFQCVVALAAPDGTLLAEAAGSCPGEIATQPAGEFGFGYDPIFWLPQFACTMAQLSAEQKRAISHRGEALRRIAPAIRRAVTNDAA